jgi:hypothetical protein
MTLAVKRVLKIFLLIALAVFIVLILSIDWLYIGKLTPEKLKIFETYPLPAALVNWHNVSVSSVEFRYSLASEYFAKHTASQPLSEANIFNELILEQKNRLLCSKLGISPTQQEIDNDYSMLANQPANGNGQNILSPLNFYGIDENAFKADFVVPELEQTDLQIWFNSQKNLNLQTYQQAQALLTDLQNGQNFAALAKSYSQDQASAITGGDLGFVDPVNLLPELREPIENMKVGDIDILASRLGLHVIKLQSRNGNQDHIYQIFLKTGDFQAWYSQATDSDQVIKLLNF